MRYLRFGDISFERNSPAWCPVTGQAKKTNEPRLVRDFIIEPNVEPRVYYRFPVTQGFTAYNSDPGCYHRDGETTDYLVDWVNTLEACNPSIERILLGQSYEGRDIEALRLGPKDRQHFAFTCVVHGNESDALAGTMKAFEILFTHPDFARLREEYTLFLIPCCNPDGFYIGTRNVTKLGPHPSGVPTTINLNRVWPWFWDEFTPTGAESKGAVPMDCPEAQAMYLWRTEGNDGEPTPIRFLMDQHATAGDGARYQSRDRNFKEISEYDWFSCWADYVIYRHVKAIQSIRVREDDMPDLFINYFRSRYVPHWHTWNANALREENGGLHPIVMVNEYNKVAYVTVETDPETYQSACNYTLDYALSCALVMQSGFYETRDAILVENVPSVGYSANSSPNASFMNWQEKSDPLDTLAYRPSYYSANRCAGLASTRANRAIAAPGRPFTLNPTLKFEVPEGTTVGPLDVHHVRADDLYSFAVASVIETGGFCFSNWSLNETLTEIGRDLVSDNTQQLRFATCNYSYLWYILLGNESTGINYIAFERLTAIRTVVATYPTARMNAAVAMATSSPTNLYVLGGETSAGVYTRTVLVVYPSTITELGTNLLPTANSGSAATFCAGGDLDEMVVMVGGKNYHSSKLRVVIIDPGSPSATEYLVTLTGTTLPRKLVGTALWYDGTDTIWIYGGKDPDTGLVHQGIWTIRWTGSHWDASDETLLADPGDAGDPEDYGGSSDWNRSWANWHLDVASSAETGGPYVFLVGGFEQDNTTGLPLPGPYTGGFVHDPQDGTITSPEYINYGYMRYNAHFDMFGYHSATSSWSFRAEPTTDTGYVRINNSTGSTVGEESILTIRRCRTYYMHPPRWWWREHAVLDLLANTNPADVENEWRAYVRVYQDNQAIAVDAPMVQVGSLWPYSWLPSDVTRNAETLQWNYLIDPRWMRVSFTFQPQASYLCLDDTLEILRIYCDAPCTSYLKVELVHDGDGQARTYVRDQVHGMVDPTIRLTYYDSVVGSVSCSVVVYWGGYFKDTARGRFDTPITFELWQHATYGCGIIVNNAGSVGKAWIPAVMLKSLWGETAILKIYGGGWWAEPIAYEITDYWVSTYAMEQNLTGAIQLGDRDGTFGQVSERSTFKYVERFTRADSTNLGDFWFVVHQLGNGWNIFSNQARCDGLGWERWSAYPYYRDVSIIGDIKVTHTSGKIGFFTRLHWGAATDGYSYGYLGSLSVDSGGNGTLDISIIPDGLYPVSLISTPCAYILSETIELEFEAVGPTLTLTARRGETVLASCTCDDATYDSPGAFGICGETAGSTSYVYFDNIHAEPRGVNKVRITD